MTEREEKPEDYIKLAQEVIRYRDHNGFSPATEANFCAKLMGINAEVYELYNELCNNNLHGIRMETADVANYVLATAYDLRGTVTARYSPVRRAVLMQDPSALCEPFRQYTALAFEKWRRYDLKDAALCVELILLECQRLAATFNFSLTSAVREKLAYNYTRPRRHGGKHPDS